MAQRRRLIVVQTEMDTQRNFVHRIIELQIGRCGVDRVAADDDEHVDAAGAHVGRKITERLHLIDRLGFDRVGVDDGLPEVAERVVHRMRERVDDRWLAVAGDDETRAAVRAEVFRDRLNPPSRPTRRTRPTRLSRPTERFCETPCKGLDLARFERQPVIGARAGGRGHALDGVQPVHAIGLFGPPARGEVARVAKPARSAAEEVGVERQDHVGLIEPVLRLDVLAERELGAGARAVAARRIPLMPRH